MSEAHEADLSDRPAHEVLWPAPRTFFGTPVCPDPSDLRAQVAFLGVPYDAGTLQPWIRTGQSAGPASARAGSWNTFEYAWPPGSPVTEGSAGWFDIERKRDYLSGITMADCGDVAIAGGQVQGNLARITEATRRLAARDSLVVAVGGDHSISFPVGRGMERYAPVDVVHFDAHPDFEMSYWGSPFSHGSQLRRLSELPWVRSITALGLRNCPREEWEDLQAYGANVATTLDMLEEGAAAVVQRLVPEAEHLYVSIDLDVLDLPLVTGTTLPEPGGLPYRALREALEAVAQKGRIVGFDVVELNPPADPSGSTSRITAWTITHFLSAIFG